MAITADLIKSNYPIPAANYRVSVIMGKKVELVSCTAVHGLDMEIKHRTYRHGLSFITGFHVMPATPTEVRLSLVGGIVKNRKYFSDWVRSVYPTVKPVPEALFRKREILIDLCDEKGQPVIRWTASKAMPVRLQGPSLSADSNSVAFELLELVAHELKVNYEV